MQLINTIVGAASQRFGLAVILVIVAAGGSAEILIPPIPGDQLTVLVEPEVTQDPNTGVYTYNYVLTNDADSIQEMWKFALAIEPGTEIISSTAPKGWRFSKYQTQPLISWAAVEVDLPDDYVDDGNIPPSPYDLAPGETLGGFSFQTLTAPSDGNFYAQGFTPLPSVTEDVEEIYEAGYTTPPFTEDSFNGITLTPAIVPYGGGRRPAVDGFLVFLNMQKNGNTFSSPVTVVIHFAAGGENVDRSSFSATLNQIDVTDLFVPDTDYGGDMVAQFDLGGTALEVGRNVLITSVEGTVPDTARTATDVDRITFDVR